jgi:hypothetical protein
MELPYSNELNELNRILIAVAELSDQDQGCSLKSVTRLCSSFALGGCPADHRKTLKLCSYTGLLLIKKKIVGLTELGREFLKSNPNCLYEITGAQKSFIAKKLIFQGPWQSRARDLFLNFSPNYSKITYELSLIENLLPVRYNSIISLLRVLKVLEKDDRKLIVTPNYVADVKRLLADRYGMYEEQLEQVLRANQKLANLAEEAVVEYERRRLRSLGCKAESEVIRRISHLDVGAGYDIESFNGDKPSVEYDRFIEVKSSQEFTLRFYWSVNERRVAEEKGDRYWIYFVGGFKHNKSEHITPIMIQNPANRLPQLSQLSFEAATYIISQCDDLPLKTISQGNLKGFVL